ncbi:MAG: amidohydrolase [Rhodospirillaceae bacterium]|nr:amidohydrolase [Rhodospirillaceae bacterium]OUX24184.1 MAG: amidohydrolase [Rhodospirillaceae bacterium TMED256]
MHDLVIRNANIVDGTGADAYSGDIAIDGGTIAQAGGTAGAGKREIAANGAMASPGWVDVHTHYDGQVTWDPVVSPSSWHGVTSIVMGNCGVGFAPVKPSDHNMLIELMEGVEDIPSAALHEGVPWNWESFPEFMDALEAMPRAIDVATQVPHNPVRAYVMGEDAGTDRTSTTKEREKMAAIVAEGMASGALGFTTSRTKFHRTSTGDHVPSHFADLEELRTIVQSLKSHGDGVIGLLCDFDEPEKDIAGFRQLAVESGRPLYYLLVQFDEHPDRWRKVLELSRPGDDGAVIHPQVCPRPVGFFLGLECTFNPFVSRGAYREIADLPLDERVKRMRDPEVRRKILSQVRDHKSNLMQQVTGAFDKMYRLGDPPNYEPSEADSILSIAKREGREPQEVAYDMLLERDGHELIYLPFTNYTDRNHEVILEMLRDKQSLFGLGDGGAHCGLICDATIPTYLLTHWVRDRKRGDRLPLEWIIKRQTRDNANFFGLHDRGVLAPGMKADVNLIDMDRLTLRPPHIVHDLPAGGRRLVQEADGYLATIQSGAVTFEEGTHTGALPGKLVRGRQKGPAT